MDGNKDIKSTINFESIHDLFPLKNQRKFEFYLENIFKDLCTTVGDNKLMGVSKIRFIDFIKLPIYICEKLFCAMDTDKDGYLSVDELIDPLSKLYFGTFEETAEFIFNLYDFDKDGKIVAEDVKMILSFLPLKTDHTKIEYVYQLESLTELDKTLNDAFKDCIKMGVEEFTTVIQTHSDIFLQLLCYLYQRCPFKEDSLNMVSRLSSSEILKDLNLPKRQGSFNSKQLMHKPIEGLKLPSKKKYSEVLLSKPSTNSKFSPAEEFIKPMESSDKDEKIKPKRKFDSFMDNSAEISGYKGMKHLVQSQSQFTKTDKNKDLKKVVEVEEHLEIVDFPDDKETKEELEKKILYQGLLYKTTDDGLNIKKSYYIVLIDQDIHYYASETREKFIKMHNVSGSFIKANGELTIKDIKYYSFSIILDKNIRTFITKNRECAKEWVKYLKQGMGYKNFFEYYEMLDNLGEGQFGQVKLGIQISTKLKVAIKIITKSKLKNQQVELLKSEIDIMKVCKHPNIVQFIDHYENSEYIFIVMEYLQHGHLRQYLTKKNFAVSEKRISQIAFQIASALKYLHVFGIIHRDLKPDNILISDIGTNFTIKLMDFGLGKILGHKEKTVEGYGTLCFVAPEIVQRTPYNNSVDIWSLGVTLYYIGSRTYPFDSNNDNEIAKKICYIPVEFPDSIWVKKSKEYKNLISSCLEKDMKKRINIDEILNHPFIIGNEKAQD